MSNSDAGGYLLSGDATDEVQKLGTHRVRSVMERAEAICRDFIHKVSVERFVGTADAREVICKTVNKLRADTLVMGCHGYDGFMKRTLFGSVYAHDIFGRTYGFKTVIVVTKK